ncbi:MAG: hypothetical protein PHE02_08935 [Lachnospiraceae bacterium]|nr:hypothetical protein [Lachnospiraceae bacterium]
MNRFGKNNSIFHHLKMINLPIIAFIILVVLFLRGINSISATTTEKQKESLQNAVYRSIVQCYAVEGTYPPSLDYLAEHYGLTYDTDQFFIDYQPIGSNLMPDVTILSKH